MSEALPHHLDDRFDRVPGRTVPRAVRAGALGYARMTACSVASRSASPWVTDFLDASYYGREICEREVDDLRFAFAILSTYWYRQASERQLRLKDLPAFNRAFGRDRSAGETGAFATLDRRQLAAGAERLLGASFVDGFADDTRRAWGIVFETVGDRERYEPTRRRRLATIGPLTPACAPAPDQLWHSYPAVQVISAAAATAALLRPETWPDYASDVARFTPLRAGGLAGQTFEIDLAASTDAGPMFTRGYATVTGLVTRDEPAALATWLSTLEAGLSRTGDGASRAMPEGARLQLGVSLTTHRGHFMGNGHNRVMVYTLGDEAFVRATSTWDPTSWRDHQASRRVGREAQNAFWGEGALSRSSMLQQLAQQLDR